MNVHSSQAYLSISNHNLHSQSFTGSCSDEIRGYPEPSSEKCILNKESLIKDTKGWVGEQLVLDNLLSWLSNDTINSCSNVIGCRCERTPRWNLQFSPSAPQHSSSLRAVYKSVHFLIINIIFIYYYYLLLLEIIMKAEGVWVEKKHGGRSQPVKGGRVGRAQVLDKEWRARDEWHILTPLCLSGATSLQQQAHEEQGAELPLSDKFSKRLQSKITLTTLPHTETKGREH